jgi:branched-chain amino acid transport system ATP-binding protein
MALEVVAVNTFYGLSHILFDVSLRVGDGEVVALLGRNGAGKTTTIKTIMGLAPPRSGRVVWHGEDITGRQPFEIAARGIGFVPEERRIFPNLTVRENLEVGIKPGRDGRRAWTLERVYTLFPQLKELERRKGGYLSGGEQQMLTIARTLMGNPDLLLLDEPSEGLAPTVVEQLAHQIRDLKREGVSILLCEQNSAFALALSDRAYIIEKGVIRHEGPAAELPAHPEIMRAFLAV